MFRNFFKRLKLKMIAKQLRRPHGVMGGKVGTMMNKANGFLYDFTLGVMQPANKDNILEIGFGNGKFFDKIFSKAGELKVTGLDFSETMYKAATEFNKETTGTGQLTLHSGSSDKMPFPADSFDKVFCINVVYFWDEPQLHLQEIVRVLKPGGRLYVTARTKESMEKMPFTKYGFSFYETGKWKTLLENSGLTFIEERLTDEPVIDPEAIGFEGNKVVTQSVCSVAEKKLL
ncbi:MAG: class I SAM-dependent methyltransferase [Ferruginibacter sp.]|nr:class I SAM-dependent methyltransferase [Chitinophagaceae bacterium]